jgi:hypothetical protein
VTRRQLGEMDSDLKSIIDGLHRVLPDKEPDDPTSKECLQYNVLDFTILKLSRMREMVALAHTVTPE